MNKNVIIKLVLVGVILGIVIPIILLLLVPDLTTLPHWARAAITGGIAGFVIVRIIARDNKNKVDK